MADFFDLIYTQLFVKLPYPKSSFSGQTIIVTGSNVGLGLEAARHFTRLDAAKVILAVRSLSKGEAAKESIETSTKRKGVVEVWHLDLGSYESVKEFAKKAEGLERLDALVENAGVARNKWSVLEDNESTITTNVVSTFLLGLLLLPKLRESGQTFNVTPHLAVTCSEVHAWSPMEERKSENIFDALNDKETANMADRYALPALYYIRRDNAANRRQIPSFETSPGLSLPRTRHSHSGKWQAQSHYQLHQPWPLPFRVGSGRRLRARFHEIVACKKHGTWEPQSSQCSGGGRGDSWAVYESMSSLAVRLIVPVTFWEKSAGMRWLIVGIYIGQDH